MTGESNAQILLGETTEIHTRGQSGEKRNRESGGMRESCRACDLRPRFDNELFHSSSSGSGDAMQNTDCAKALMSVSATKHGGARNVERNKKWVMERIEQ